MALPIPGGFIIQRHLARCPLSGADEEIETSQNIRSFHGSLVAFSFVISPPQRWNSVLNEPDFPGSSGRAAPSEAEIPGKAAPAAPAQPGASLIQASRFSRIIGRQGSAAAGFLSQPLEFIRPQPEHLPQERTAQKKAEITGVSWIYAEYPLDAGTQTLISRHLELGRCIPGTPNRALGIGGCILDTPNWGSSSWTPQTRPLESGDASQPP